MLLDFLGRGWIHVKAWGTLWGMLFVAVPRTPNAPDRLRNQGGKIA